MPARMLEALPAESAARRALAWQLARERPGARRAAPPACTPGDLAHGSRGGRNAMSVLQRSPRGARRLPCGAEPMAGGVHIRVWAPARRRVAVVPEHGEDIALAPERGGY